MNIQFYQKLTLLDYPEKTACTVFTYGCNLRCPFCHNAALVTDAMQEPVNEDDFFDFLEKRKGLLDGVCITGGEPLLQKDISDFIKKIKDKGFLVKLDTNGFFPEKLKELIDEGIIDYVAMDIKNSLEKYPETCGVSNINIEKVKESVEILKSGKVDFEFRTTVLQEYHTQSDFESIGKWLSGNYKYYIQCFKDSGNTIASNLNPLEEDEIFALKSTVSAYLPLCKIRGV